MTEDKKKNEQKKEETSKPETVIPPLDFSSLVLPFYTQALLSLGTEKEKESNKEEKTLELVKRLIDLLDLLKEKSQGNLKPEEEKFLTSCLHQLKLSYMERAKIIKL
jgi:hypothetical protein